MDECTIEAYLKCITRGFNVSFDVIAIDELHLTPNTTFPRILILNTFKRNSTSRLGHWICLFMVKSRKSEIKIEFYDPLACTPEFYGIKFPFFISWKTCARTQPNYSNKCGLYVLLYCYHRLRKISPSKIVQNIFEVDALYNNEIRAQRFEKRLRRQCRSLVIRELTLCSSDGFLVRRHFQNQQKITRKKE